MRETVLSSKLTETVHCNLLFSGDADNSCVADVVCTFTSARNLNSSQFRNSNQRNFGIQYNTKIYLYTIIVPLTNFECISISGAKKQISPASFCLSGIIIFPKKIFYDF